MQSDHFLEGRMWQIPGKEDKRMNKFNLKKLTVTAILAAVAVVGSLFSFPVFGSKCAPVQHLVNILCAVTVGPWWALAQAFIAALIRNLLGLGSPLAFPGSMCGALLGGVYCNPASHGEGRFVANDEWLKKLKENGQIATEYVPVDETGYEGEFNVNGSYMNIEGITSPDGRVLGKMAHSERRDAGVAVNIYGEQDIKIFESGVEYFR